MISQFFHVLKKYLRYHNIKITKEDMENSPDFPYMIKEEKHPLTKEELQDIESEQQEKLSQNYRTVIKWIKIDRT